MEAPDSDVRRTMSLIADRTPGIDALVLTRTDGDVVSAVGATTALLRSLTSFAVGLHQLAERLGDEAGRGQADTTIVQCEAGHLAVYRVGDDHVLLALSNEAAPIGVLHHDGRVGARLMERTIQGAS